MLHIRDCKHLPRRTYVFIPYPYCDGDKWACSATSRQTSRCTSGRAQGSTVEAQEQLSDPPAPQLLCMLPETEAR